MATAHGVAEVVGTRFSLSENRDQTTLAVQDGRVDLHQKDQRLEVRAGETAVADAAGMRKLAPADAWITELLARAEAGPWDVVNRGTGVYSNDVWRMDARGGPAERRIWNMISGGNDRHYMVIFRDGKRWARGVVVGRMMLLPESQAALEVVGSASATNMAWRTYNYRVTGAPAAYQKLQKASVSLNFVPPGKEEIQSMVRQPYLIFPPNLSSSSLRPRRPSYSSPYSSPHCRGAGERQGKTKRQEKVGCENECFRFTTNLNHTPALPRFQISLGMTLPPDLQCVFLNTQTHSDESGRTKS